jgi:hypothetical protein
MRPVPRTYVARPCYCVAEPRHHLHHFDDATSFAFQMVVLSARVSLWSHSGHAMILPLEVVTASSQRVVCDRCYLKVIVRDALNDVILRHTVVAYAFHTSLENLLHRAKHRSSLTLCLESRAHSTNNNRNV